MLTFFNLSLFCVYTVAQLRYSYRTFKQRNNAMNAYPEDIKQFNTDPRSPFFDGYVCTDCKKSDIDCECEAEVLQAKIDALNEKIETLQEWADEAKSTEFFGINFIDREINALLYSYKDELSKVEA